MFQIFEVFQNRPPASPTGCEELEGLRAAVPLNTVLDATCLAHLVLAGLVAVLRVPVD